MVGKAYRDPHALALIRTAVRGDAKEVERLVKAGTNPNRLEEGTVTMLIWTMCAKSKDGYEALLGAGACDLQNASHAAFSSGKYL